MKCRKIISFFHYESDQILHLHHIIKEKLKNNTNYENNLINRTWLPIINFIKEFINGELNLLEFPYIIEPPLFINNCI